MVLVIVFVFLPPAEIFNSSTWKEEMSFLPYTRLHNTICGILGRRSRVSAVCMWPSKMLLASIEVVIESNGNLKSMTVPGQTWN